MVYQYDVGSYEGPQTLSEIVKLLVSGMIKNLKKKLLVMAAVFLAVWIIHTYVLVWINEGFNPSSTIVGNILALSGTEIGGSLFWMLLMFLITATVLQIKKKGSGGFIDGFKDISGIYNNSKEDLSDEYSALLAGGAGICLFIGWILFNYLVAILLAVVLLFALAAKNESLLVLCTRIGYSDAKRQLSGAKEFSPLDMQRTVLVFTGGAAGFIVAAILPSLITLILAIAAIGYCAYWYHNKNNPGQKPPAVAASCFFFVILCSMFIVVPVLADDGGWSESGGTFENWIGSEGAAIAVAMGLPPAAASVIGILIATLGVDGAATVIASGGLGAGFPGTSGSGSSVPETKIYGSGTPEDPYRDEFTIGETQEDGSLKPYPENKDKPREIWGKGTPDDPYRDYPGETAEPETPEPEPEVSPKEPEQVPEVPEQEPEPEIPKTEPKQEPEAPPEEPEQPVVEPPAEPEPPVEPPVVPPETPTQPQPPEKTGPSPDDVKIYQEEIKKLEEELADVKKTWAERKKKVAELEKAKREYKKNSVRALIKGAIETTKAVTDPKGKIWDGVKDKLDVKTPLDKIKDKSFGKEVKMEEIGKDMKNSWDKYEDLKNEVNNMPNEQELLDKSREIRSKISRLSKYIREGGN